MLLCYGNVSVKIQGKIAVTDGSEEIRNILQDLTSIIDNIYNFTE